MTTYRYRLILAVVIPLTTFQPAVAAGLEVLQQSVVRIVNHSQRGDWASPWDSSLVGEVSGSGFVIEGGLVMTNAHVVSDSRLLLIQTNNNPDTHVAEVVFIAHDCDLALIRPVEEGALADIPPLRFGELPELGATVDTLGFPAGGLRVSSTRGVVSRIEHQLYVHSGIDVHVAVQTDAAINAGNSGGPVMRGSEVVGVAFQTDIELQNVGYFIPPEVIERFLLDVKDGHYDGYPELGVDEANLVNPAFRSFVGLDDNETGVAIHGVTPGCSAEGLLLDGDIVLAVNDRLVANDGTVSDEHTRIPFGLLVDRMQIGETVTLHILRDGSRLELKIPLHGCPMLRRRAHAYDRLPRYLVYGGLVFVELELETLKTFGENWNYDAPTALLTEFLVRPLREPELIQQARVVLLRRLKHPVNADFAYFRNQVVERVNGQTITSLDDLVSTLDRQDAEFQVFEFSTGNRVGVLVRRSAEAAGAEILESYGIEQDRRL